MDWLDLFAVQGTLLAVQEPSPTPQFKSICERVVYKITLFLHLFNCFFLGSALYFLWLDVALCSRAFGSLCPGEV